VQFPGQMATYSGDGQNKCGNCTWCSNGDVALFLYSKSLVLRIGEEIPVLNNPRMQAKLTLCHVNVEIVPRLGLEIVNPSI